MVAVFAFSLPAATQPCVTNLTASKPPGRPVAPAAGGAPPTTSTDKAVQQPMSSTLAAPGQVPQLDAAYAEALCGAAAATSGGPSVAGGTAAGPLPAAGASGKDNVETGSPTAVTTLHGASESCGPATPLADVASASTSTGGGSGGGGGRRPASVPSPTGSVTTSESASDLQQAVQQAMQQAGQMQQRSLKVDIPTLVQRLKERPLTGQVVAWGWDAAAAYSSVRRTMPAQLFSSLWPATEACVFKMMPQDVLEMLESWLTLMQQCPRHFRLSKGVLEALATYALPAAVKRMGEEQLAQLACLARDIALNRSDPDMQVGSPTRNGASARDLMQPVFSLVAAETVWRCNNPARYVSPETVSTVVTAAPAWSWRVVRHRDRQPLAALKLATAAALEELRPHSPRDLAPGAFGKLKVGSTGDGSSSSRRGASLDGGSRQGASLDGAASGSVSLRSQ